MMYFCRPVKRRTFLKLQGQKSTAETLHCQKPAHNLTTKLILQNIFKISETTEEKLLQKET